MAAPLGAFVGAFQFLSGLNPRGRRYDVSVSSAGRVTVTARISNFKSPGMRRARELARQASDELTRLLADGTAPSDQVIGVVRDFTQDQVNRIDAWTVTHPIVGEQPEVDTPPPKRPRPIAPPPGKEPGVGLPPEEEADDDDLDYSSVVGGEQITPVGSEDFFMPRFVRGLHKSIPGGAAGMAQQTPATLTRIGGALRTGTAGRRRARRARSNGAARPRRRRAAAGSGRRKNGRFVKGSAAAKRHMAKLRRMRK